MPLKLLMPDHRQDEGDEGRKKCPQVGEDLADVAAAAAENGEEGVAECSFQEATREAAVGLHVADLGLGIVYGGRRLAGLKIAVNQRPDLAHVRVRMAPDEKTALEWAAIENTARKDLPIVREIRSFAQMREAGSSVPQIARAFAVTEAHVYRRLKLADLPDPVHPPRQPVKRGIAGELVTEPRPHRRECFGPAHPGLAPGHQEARDFRQPLGLRPHRRRGLKQLRMFRLVIVPRLKPEPFGRPLQDCAPDRVRKVGKVDVFGLTAVCVLPESLDIVLLAPLARGRSVARNPGHAKDVSKRTHFVCAPEA